MKSIVFKVINIIYKIASVIFKVNDKRIVMECDYGKGFYGNLLSIYEEIGKQNLDYEIIIPINKNIKLQNYMYAKTRIVRARGVRHFYYLVTSKFWLINNHYYFFLKKRSETICINTWHALGAFKKFALDCDDGKREEHILDGNNIDYLLVSSKSVADIYSKALNVSSDKIVSIGIPRTDMLFNEELKEDISRNLRKQLNCNNKKVILYAPTFRDGEKYNFDLKLDLEAMNENLRDEYVLLIKLHPIIRNKINIPDSCKEFVKEVNTFNINDLLVLTDILITDYSSVVFDYSLLKKPMIFFAYDLNEFKSKSREFYFGYEEFIPDKCVTSTKDVIEKIKLFDKGINGDLIKKIESFSEKYCDFRDGRASERFVKKFLIKGEEK